MNTQNDQPATPIPAIIHYVWVGGKDKPDLIKRCQKTWQKQLGAYTLIEWNEQNFGIDSHPFVKQAYAEKKWAFVSDYIRAWAVYTHGGIYLDTDVVVLDDLSQFRTHRAFVGFEREGLPFTATFGAEPGHPFVKKILDQYDGLDFRLDKNDELAAANTNSVSRILLEEYHCPPKDGRYDLEDGIAVYPSGILCNPSLKSSTIHIFTGTWLSKLSSARKAITALKSYITTKRQAALYAKIVARKSFPTE